MLSVLLYVCPEACFHRLISDFLKVFLVFMIIIRVYILNTVQSFYNVMFGVKRNDFFLVGGGGLLFDA